MENKEVMLNQRPRDIDVVTAEIKNLCEEARLTVLLYSAEIGRRLVEAKEILPHGEWSEWLKTEVHFSQRTAENHMKIFTAYGSPQVSIFGAELKSKTFANLSYSAALKLLVVPEDEREEFVLENDIKNKSVREIDKLIKERDEARQCAEGLKNGIDDLREQLETAQAEAAEQRKIADELLENKNSYSTQMEELEGKLETAKAAEKKAKEKLKELKDNPEIPQSKIDELRADIEKQVEADNAAEIEKQLADMKKQLAASAAAEEEARRAAENAAGKVTELEKQVRISDPAVAEFRSLFKHIQDYIFEAKTALDNIKDKPTADKLRGALKALAAELEG